MEYPKKLVKKYPEGKNPVKIIRGSGQGVTLRVVEYRFVKRVGENCIYKRV